LEPLIKYVYLDGDAMDAFDRFEDDTLPAAASSAMSEGGSQRSDEEEDDSEEKDARWERDKAIFMEHEIERLKEELVMQKEKARKEAEAAGELVEKKEEVAVAGAVAGDEKKEVAVAGAVEPEQKAEPAPKPVYANVGLYGKAMSKEEQKARRLERLLYR
jgi:hypothetical protein